MANTYTKVYIHFVFAVQNRQSLIKNDWKDELYKYITGIVQNNGHKMLIINGMQDHIHFLVGLKPVQSMSKLIQVVKANSSRWINERGFTKRKFNWQEGFGAFSYSHSQLDNIIGYIQNQEIHHKKTSFREEYFSFLKKFNIEHNENYVFKSID